MELKTVEKACQVFKCFAQGDSSIGATELSDRLGINHSTMSRLLGTLKSQGFLEQERSTRRYRLGPVMAELARAVHRSFDCKVTNVAVPHVDGLRDKIGETIALEVLSGNTFYHAYVANSLNPVSLRVVPGDKVMPNAHVGAKAIIAFSRPHVIDYWLGQDLPRYTKNSITDPKMLRDIYSDIRNSGISYDYGEYIEEVNAIGAPIFNYENKPVAAVAITAISYPERKKWDMDYILYLKETANKISSCLHSSRQLEVK